MQKLAFSPDKYINNINNNLLTTVENKTNKTCFHCSKFNYNSCKLSNNCEQINKIDFAVEQALGLINPEFRMWHLKAANQIGAERYLLCYRLAKDGRQPRRLFTFLLNRELGV